MKKRIIWVACIGILSVTNALAQDKIVLKGKELFGDIQTDT
jgi:hypothetical protein